MKRLFVFIAIALLLSNCSKDKVDCSLLDPAMPAIYLKLVDSNGNNLLENGTIDPNAITLQSGLSFRFNPASNYVGTERSIFDNTLELQIPYESTFQYIIKLNDTDVISLDFSAKLFESPCISVYIPTDVVYKNQNLELRNVFSLDFIVEVEI